MANHEHVPKKKRRKSIANWRKTNDSFKSGTKAKCNFLQRAFSFNFFICISIRLARAGPRSEPTTYETIAFNGSFRRADAAPRGTRSSNYPPGLQMLRRPRCGRDDSIPLHSIGGNDIVSVCCPPNFHFTCIRYTHMNEWINQFFSIFLCIAAIVDFDCDGSYCEAASHL